MPITKVYIGARCKTKDSKSNSELKFEFKQSIQLPANCVCYIDDIIIPHTWYTVEHLNNQLYVREYDNSSRLLTTDRILTIAGQNYTGDLLAASIQNCFRCCVYNNYIYGNIHPTKRDDQN